MEINDQHHGATPDSETPEQTFEKVYSNIGDMYTEMGLCKAYHTARQKIEAHAPDKSLPEWQDKIASDKYKRENYEDLLRLANEDYSNMNKVFVCQLEALQQFHDQEVKAMREEIENNSILLEAAKQEISRFTSQSVQVLTNKEIGIAIFDILKDYPFQSVAQKEDLVKRFGKLSDFMRTKLSTGAGSQWVSVDSAPENDSIVWILFCGRPKLSYFYESTFYQLPQPNKPLQELSGIIQWSSISPPKNQ